MALNNVWERIFWTSNIFVIIVFPYTHDTGAVTGTEPGVEFYKRVNRDKYWSFPTFQYLRIELTYINSPREH